MEKDRNAEMQVPLSLSLLHFIQPPFSFLGSIVSILSVDCIYMYLTAVAVQRFLQQTLHTRKVKPGRSSVSSAPSSERLGGS